MTDIPIDTAKLELDTQFDALDLTASSTIAVMAYSQAISLKRIADALDNLAALHAAGPALKATGMSAVNQPEPLGVVPVVRTGPVPQPDDDGWIEWHGGECPVPKGVRVEYRLRNNSQGPWALSENIYWPHVDGDTSWEVTAYRLAK